MIQYEIKGSNFDVPFHYSMSFSEQIFSKEHGAFLSLFEASKDARIYVVMEHTVANHFPRLQEQITELIGSHPQFFAPLAGFEIVDGGESCKNLDYANYLCSQFLKAGLCRQSYLVIIGGGALLDTAGFAAAIFHRGIRQIRVPTTALSQCDSGVGVKNAVNAFGKKNLLGTFAPPIAVLNDVSFLRTLPRKAISEAAAEAIKVALIKDAGFFDSLLAHAPAILSGSEQEIQSFIYRSAVIHMNHIARSGDPFEYGSARPLDFGHWAAHKLEMLSDNFLSHGIGVGMGMRIDTKYAVLKGIAPESVYRELCKALHAFQLPFHASYLEMREPDGTRSILQGIEEFREHLGGRLHITLPIGIGSKVEVHEMDDAYLEEAIVSILREQSEEEA